MIIIAFSRKTAKILPRLFCSKWKHVAPIVVHNDKIIMYQFVKYDDIQPIPLRMRDIGILGQYGWEFIFLEQNSTHNFNTHHAYTCVQFTKRVIGISNYLIQTPDALYKYITQ